MSLSLVHVDAFTERPFAGDPAAVCLLSSWREDQWLEDVAKEMNLSETDFLAQKADRFDLCWFSPKSQVESCCHATLASAHVLWQHGPAKPGEEIRFSSRRGVLKAVRQGSEIELDFPLKPKAAAEPPQGLVAALGVLPRYVGKKQFDYLVESASGEFLQSIAPAFKRLMILPVRGIVLTSRSADPTFDFVSRFFGPSLGADKASLIGATHCCLGDFRR